MPKKIEIDLELPFHQAKRLFERAYVDRMLQQTNGNVTEAARQSGKDRKDFYDLMERAGIFPTDYR